MSRLDGQGQGRRLPGLLLAAALWACPPPAVALDLPLQVAQYARTSWTARDGAVQGLVFAMAQTPDGYLWIAGSSGLFRFDGLRFERWQPPGGQALPSGPYSLLVSRDGTLWIGTFSGLSSWNGREFVYRHPGIGLGRFVTSLLEDRDGTVWVGVLGERGELCAIRAGKVQCDVPEGGFGSFVWSLAQDRSGALWVGAESGLWRWRPGEPRRYAIPGSRVGDLTLTADGEVLAGMQGAGLHQLDGDRLVAHRFRRAGKPHDWLADADIKSNKLLRDRDGGLWIGTASQGIIHVKDGRADTFTRADGLSGSITCSLFEDREGNIWFGSDKGLDRFRKLPVSTLSTRQGLPHEVTRSVVATRDGSVWVATNDGLARWKADGSLRVYRQRDGLPDSQVHSQYEDADGRLWASTARGLAYFANDRFVAVDDGPDGDVHAITGDAQGNLWLLGSKGLTRLHRGRRVEHVPWPALGIPKTPQGIVAHQGGLWLSFWDGGVSLLKDGRIQTTYTAAQGLGKGQVTGVRFDAAGALWAATGAGGLSRIQDGRVTTLSVANGLPCKAVHWSLQDDSGSLWMYAECGLMRVAHDDLAAWIADPSHRVAPKLWGAADGVTLTVAPPAYYNPAVAKGPDGKLWIVGAGEVQLVDPLHVPHNPVPPPVHIERLVADQQSYAVADGLRLPALARDITISFAALTLTDPKSTRFRYRLEGHDTDWQEAVDRRLAIYTNLPPGNYRFHVTAANNSGVWNEEGAQLEFSILPAFYQTTWFRLACAAVLFGLAWAGFQLRLHMRMRRLQRQFEATLDARVAERTRIARDLHDTLLQRFHGLLLEFQAALNLLPGRPHESKEILTRAVDHVAEAITEGRDTVQALRASVVETNNLPAALRALAKDLASESGHVASADVQVHDTPQLLHPLVRDETFRIAGEALRNAFRHADAKRIDVEVRYEPQQLCVRVRDDGKGIDPEVLSRGEKQGHFGLGGMHERAAVAGGTLAIRNAAGGGTEVEFSVPGSRAYGSAPPARSRRLQRWFAPGTAEK
ncbi:sensor histidine kinase [Pelomonas sp. Root1444]|uniref:sensor histidine kinase n=1 Tax=Pelomonas sp. Root1444 TaxID=1736464 RepID=UPI0012F72DF5|nr:sensor histidine kinase [Pelomonas sp. Root1444]